MFAKLKRPTGRRVAAKVWNRWSVFQRQTFNRVYEKISTTGVDIFCVGMGLSDKQFDVVAWNSAWYAADCVADG